MSYLHPSQRPLKTEQIGPSSHKNEYHVGVLEGNWFEERNAFGRQANGPVKFDARTTAKSAYPPHMGSRALGGQPQVATASEAPRQLLFGHGHPQTNLLSTAELSYQDPASPEATQSSTKLPSIVGVSKRNAITEKKKQKWIEDMDDSYTTTKNATFDATAATIASAPPREVYQPYSATHHGECLRSLGSNMRKTGLRE